MCSFGLRGSYLARKIGGNLSTHRVLSLRHHSGIPVDVCDGDSDLYDHLLDVKYDADIFQFLSAVVDIDFINLSTTGRPYFYKLSAVNRL